MIDAGVAQRHPLPAIRVSTDLPMLKPLPRLLILRLVLKERIIGAVAFFANESGCFTERHADLAALLKEPFAVAMSNCVRYKQLLNLKNRLADDNQFLISEINQSVGKKLSAPISDSMVLWKWCAK